jgi:hypothetical protein
MKAFSIDRAKQFIVLYNKETNAGIKVKCLENFLRYFFARYSDFSDYRKNASFPYCGHFGISCWYFLIFFPSVNSVVVDSVVFKIDKNC